MKSTPSIYLAGPTVFLRDSNRAFEQYEAWCCARNLRALRPAEPFDENGQMLQGTAAARYLFLRNTARIRSPHGVLADWRAFRGDLEPDSGTVFEVGFAYALGKPVAALTADDRDWGSRIRAVCGVGEPNASGGEMDARYDRLIEDFGGPLNLMLSQSCQVFTEPRNALDWLANSVSCT